MADPAGKGTDNHKHRVWRTLMHIRFWGVRGSLPAPQLPSQVKSKISAILERAKAANLDSPEKKERFLGDLPPWLFGTVGGNTSCVSVHFSESQMLILDAGSGIRELGLSLGLEKTKVKDHHIFFSHFHWDHIMGLPFFGPAYDPEGELHFYHPTGLAETALQGQMSSPYFPIGMDAMSSEKKFHTLPPVYELHGVQISHRKMNHPGGSYSYKIDDGKHQFIYATDTEISSADFLETEENKTFFLGADLIVIDSQYTLGEAIEKYNWGHSAFSMAVDFAANWNIKHIVFFHHDPAYDDHKLINNLQSARLYMERLNIHGMELSLAMEGMEITL